MAGTNTTINYEQLARLDYVFKQNAANKVKTDGLTGQTAISSDNERSARVPILRADRIWLDSTDLLPGPRAIPWGSNVPVQLRNLCRDVGSSRDHPRFTRSVMESTHGRMGFHRV